MVQKKKVLFLFLLLSDRDGDRKWRKKGWALVFLAAVKRPKQNRWDQQSFKSLLLLISEGKATYVWSLEIWVLWFLLRTLSWMSNREHLSPSRRILLHFNYPLHSIPLFFSSLHLYGHHRKREKKKNIMWTFCLIKGLDTLPWSRRKAPFISSYWIFVCVVSLLFNFMPQFAFITVQPREPVDIQNNATQGLSISSRGIDWKVSACITI